MSALPPIFPPHPGICVSLTQFWCACPCSFVALYDRDGMESIGLDDASRRLGVERRRIYDIVNVLESVGVSSSFLLLSFFLLPD